MLERASRKLDALKVAVVDVVDRNGLYAEDGHRSAKTWLAFTCRISTGEAHRRVSFAKMFRTLNDKPFENETTPTEIKLFVPEEMIIEDWGIPDFERDGVTA